MGKVVEGITKQEFSIIELLIEHPNQVFSKEEIFEYAWDEPYMGETKTLDVHISNIRKKIKKLTEEEYIQTVWGIGYNMLEELFMFTKLKNESFNIEESLCCISRILKQTVFSYYDEWTRLGITPQLQICEEAIFIMGSEQALRRVFQNIIKNGLVHGKNNIRVEMNTINLNPEYVNIIISNEVENPSKIDTERVFERFYKLDEARNVSSSGLGLSISKELVERMNGSIDAFVLDNRFCVKIVFATKKAF